MAVQPFRIEVKQPVLDDLQDRLAKARFATGMEGTGWDYGTNPAYLEDLCGYWRRDFDWRKQESYLNGFPQFRAEVDGVGIRFIREKGRRPVTSPALTGNAKVSPLISPRA